MMDMCISLLSVAMTFKILFHMLFIIALCWSKGGFKEFLYNAIESGEQEQELGENMCHGTEQGGEKWAIMCRWESKEPEEMRSACAGELMCRNPRYSNRKEKPSSLGVGSNSHDLPGPPSLSFLLLQPPDPQLLSCW